MVSVGKDRSGLFEPGVHEYAKRISRHAHFELVELPAAKLKKADPKASKAQEQTAILAKVRPRDCVVALDERGKMLSTAELFHWVGRAQSESKGLFFAIGGDEGLGPEVVEKADLVLSLSRMTFPHRLARLILVEQIYRAFTLLKGEPYHKQ